MSPSEVRPADDAEFDELRAILDQELARLPERYRGVVVLCELEGLSRHAAAHRLGIPEGTLSSRLARAKDLLRHRLIRRGLTPSALALNAALAPEAGAILIPPSLAGSTIQAAACVAAGLSLAEAAPTSVAILTQGVLKAMLIAKFKGLVLGLTVATVVTTGIGVLAQSPGPAASPDGDRLSALERKLDRILEALGGSRGDAPRTLPPTTTTRVDARKNAASPDVQLVLPPPATSLPPQVFGDRLGHRILAPAASSDDRLAHVVPDAPHPPAARLADVVPDAPHPPAVPPPPAGPSRDLDARVDALERRLGEMERRFGEMERRIGRTMSGSATRPAERAK